MGNFVKQDLHCHGSRRPEEPELTLKEWGLKARISRENTSSRRFSAALNIRSFREDAATSFRSNFNISSTASSPGYTLRGEIDPSTYSFTTALKALQAKTVYSWEYLDGFTLNSKWNDAEKYICNPLSGEVPLECLSAKTLNGRSFRNLTSRITMSAPLIYPSPHTQGNGLRKSTIIIDHDKDAEATSREKKVGASATRDVGTQSTPVDVSSGSPSPTHSLEEKLAKIGTKDEDGKPSVCGSKTQVQVTKTAEQQPRKRNGGGERQKMLNWRNGCCGSSQGGCLSLWRRRRPNKNTKNNHPKTIPSTVLDLVNGCTQESQVDPTNLYIHPSA